MIDDGTFDPKRFLATLTNRPGVYRMLDARGRVVYVGKARDLKKRVASYFGAKAHHPKTQALMRVVDRVEVTVTASEQEALLLEYTQIKAHAPRLQRALPGRQELPLYSRDHAPGLSQVRISPRFPQGAGAVLRALSRRGQCARSARPVAETVPRAPVPRFLFCQPHAAVPAAPDQPLHGTVCRPGESRRLRARRCQRDALSVRAQRAGGR